MSSSVRFKTVDLGGVPFLEKQLVAHESPPNIVNISLLMLVPAKLFCTGTTSPVSRQNYLGCQTANINFNPCFTKETAKINQFVIICNYINLPPLLSQKLHPYHPSINSLLKPHHPLHHQPTNLLNPQQV